MTTFAEALDAVRVAHDDEIAAARTEVSRINEELAAAKAAEKLATDRAAELQAAVDAGLLRESNLAAQVAEAKAALLAAKEEIARLDQLLNPFQIGKTIPTVDNVGLRPGIKRTKYTGPAKITGYATLEEARAKPYKDLDFDQAIRVTSGYAVFDNVMVIGANPEGAIQCYDAAVKGVEITHAYLVPLNPAATQDGVFGHHFTLRYSRVERVVDGVGVLGDDVVVEANLFQNFAWFKVDGIHADGSHNDALGQVHKGKRIRFRGNMIVGFRTVAVGGAFPSNQCNQILLVQHTAGLVGEIEVLDNWWTGGSSGFKFESITKFKGAPAARVAYDVVFKGNRKLDRVGIPLRPDALVSINGITRKAGTYTDDLANGNTFPDGTPITIRVDAA